MLFTRIYDDDLAQASYFIGCQATGEAVVVDPRRDIQVYLEEAEKHAMRIVAVTETHIHADYLRAPGSWRRLRGEALPLRRGGCRVEVRLRGRETLRW